MPLTLLPVTTPLRLLLAVAVVWLKAFEKLPVDPLLSATERAALARAAPELRLLLWSLLSLVVVLESVFVLVLVLLFVLLSCKASAVSEALAPPPDCVFVSASPGPAATPRASATAEARSVLFMESPGWLVELLCQGLC